MKPEFVACPDEAEWLRFWDGEVNGPEAERLGQHLQMCHACQRQLAAVGELAQFADRGLPPAGASRTRRSSLAWRPWAVAAAVGVVLLAGGANPLWRKGALAAVGQLFQVNRIGAVAITPAQLTRLDQVVTQGGQVSLAHYGSVRVMGPLRQLTVPPRQLPQYGMPDLWPVQFGANALATVDNGVRVEFRLNVPAVNQLIVEQGGDRLFPEALNQRPFTVYVPAYARISQTGSHGSWTVEEAPQPTLAIPEGVNFHQVVNALSGLPFLPPTLSQAVLQMANWKNTLLVPLPGSPENVTVHGNPAVLDTGNENTTAGVAWVDRGVVVAVFHHQATAVNRSAFLTEVQQAVP